MIVLAIHTAGAACELALIDGAQTLGVRRVEMMRGQDARLPELTQALLRDAGLSFDALDRLAVVTGPGSFTGIRVGVAFARGLALATTKPCLGITTLEAALPEGQQGSAIVVLPAQKRPPDLTFWVQTFRTGLATGAAQELSDTDLRALLRARPHIVFGDREAVRPHLPEHDVHAAAPSALTAARLAMRLDPQSRSAQPTYARAPDAALPQNTKRPA